MPVAPQCDLFVVVGEPSGDAYGAAVVAELRRRHPELVVAAMGGPALAAAGAEIDEGIDGLAVMGIWPVLARLPEFSRLMTRVAAGIRARKPKAVLTIDYPGFNLRLARRLSGLRADGCKLVHLVAPQVWAWRPRRAKRIAQSVDRLLCFFPFEPPLFNRFGACRAEHVGHPLLDLIPPVDPVVMPAARHALGLNPEADVLLLAPGSRAREVRLLLPILHRAAELALPHLPGAQVAVSRVPEQPLDLYRAATHFPLVEGRWRDVCRAAHLGVIASGTATLEAALIGLPHLITYRLDPLTAAVARQVVRTPHAGLPNLVLNRRACPELMQDQCTPERIAARIIRLWRGNARAAQQSDLTQVRERLGGAGALARIADALEQELRRGRRHRTI